METRKHLLLLKLTLLLKGLCECFNVDVNRPRIFSGPEDALFGFSVLQHEVDGEKLMLVGAPWDGPPNNRIGDVYKCTVGDELNSNCSKVNLAESAFQNVSRNLKNSHLGMTLAPNESHGFLACAPLWSQECGTSVFSTGICASVDNELQPKETIAPTAQRCTTYMDIVIVLDGSNSIYPWYEVQNFLSNILSKFHISPEQMQVGVLQYGEISVHEWSLKDYQSTPDVVEAAKNISRQEGRETRTAYAIHMACTEAFSAERGAREGATKVMIVVTDGESHDGEELPEALDECEKRNITRYAIAVLGHYIRRQQDPETFINEIKYIASDPDEKYFFNVTDEAALNDIVDALGDRIFSLEGTLSYNESAFLMEMSQIGFSTHILDDGILFGMVGAYDWEGGVLKESSDGRIMPPREAFEKEFPLELKKHAAYLGYTVSSVTVGDWRRLYVAGAPRFKHKGKVILFDLSPNGDVTITQALNGEQIGSYFGSEVCGVDVDQDGITDILLIAAPMFLGAGNKETGKVYVYCLDGEGFAPNGTLHAQSKAQDARFGYAMAVAPDLNHDGYADLLVGAPLEDDHQGALYIYHGDEYYIIPQYKQRISGSSLSPGLQYFGRSLSALLDMDGDELLDLAVGAQGSAVLLRSRSIVQINVSLSFQPHSINVIQKNCHRGGRESACLNASACFFANSRSPGAYGTYFDLQVGAMLDDRKLSARALFDSSSQRQTVIGVRVQVGNTLCQTLPFHVFDTADYIRPISFSLNFKINDTESGPVLDEGWPTTVKKTIPFYKDCGEDDVCVTDLNLKAHMDISGTRQHPYVIRSPRRRLAVEVQLQNRLENAYNTSLTLHYSRNLHFSSLSIREDAQFKIECTALSSNSHSCNVSYPVFRSQSKVNFMLEFEFSCTFLLNKVQMKLVAASDSVEREDTLSDNTVGLYTVVQYEPDLFITSDSNLNRYEVHPTRTVSEGTGPEFYTHFRVQNLGCYVVRNLELRVSLPAVASGDRVFSSVVEASSHNASGVNCSVRSDLAQLKAAQTDVRPLHPEDMKKNEILNCSTAWCMEVVCDIQQLLKGQTAFIRITRRVHDNFFRQAKFKAVMIVGSYHLSARESSLVTLGNAALWRETVLEVLKGRSIPISLWILIGSIIGGLLLLALIIFVLWKLGFFTRKQRTDKDENHDD
ncbi:integrin alpha-10 [Colossoma macropomum]|uniref:integrin alpha-10 n=1 Tax=Colossoma macropomum TaxID=42526 RepID=UPI001864B7B8|nr:integrin alpha-10 [Colossoma macropomum]XP_036451979.1 integrin alpha-10 [Colossoma macropomum]XP_036451988.1 integrin alpha-10 [Colossoma macropomum]